MTKRGEDALMFWLQLLCVFVCGGVAGWIVRAVVLG